MTGAQRQPLLDKLARIDCEIGKAEALMLETIPLAELHRLVDLVAMLRLQHEQVNALLQAAT